MTGITLLDLKSVCVGKLTYLFAGLFITTHGRVWRGVNQTTQHTNTLTHLRHSYCAHDERMFEIEHGEKW